MPRTKANLSGTLAASWCSKRSRHRTARSKDCGSFCGKACKPKVSQGCRYVRSKGRYSRSDCPGVVCQFGDYCFLSGRRFRDLDTQAPISYKGHLYVSARFGCIRGGNTEAFPNRGKSLSCRLLHGENPDGRCRVSVLPRLLSTISAG